MKPKIPTEANGRTSRLPGEFRKNSIKLTAAAIEISANGIASSDPKQKSHTEASNSSEIFENLFKRTADQKLKIKYQATAANPKEVDINDFPEQEAVEYGRTLFLSDSQVSIKAKKEEETSEDLKRELQRQEALSKDPRFLSKIPKPVGFDSTEQASVFIPPEGYYDYLSKIKDEQEFSKAASKAAFDLGYLLKNYGLVFPNLISVFHAKDRAYTLLPELFDADNVYYGGFPGKIEGVVGEELYENIGASGVRDLGDLENLSDYKLTKINASRTAPSGHMVVGPAPKYEEIDLNLSESQKVAHFISLYLMVFTILIGNRSRALETSEENLAMWKDNDKIFSDVMKSMFMGLGYELSKEELSYLDPSMLEEKDGMQPSEKFNSQLYFAFTKFKDKVFPADVYSHKREVKPEAQQTLHEQIYGTPRIRFNAENKFYFCSDSTASEKFEYSSLYGFGTDDETKGYLGNYSGINPLITASKYSLRAAQFAVLKLYNLSQEFYPQLEEIKAERKAEKQAAKEELKAAAVVIDSASPLAGSANIKTH